MLTIDDLSESSLRIDLSKYVQPSHSGSELMDKLTLGTLRSVSFSHIRAALGKVQDNMAIISYGRSFGRFQVSLEVFERMRMSLMISKLPTLGENPENAVKTLSVPDLQSIGTDFNFVLGTIRGMVAAKDLPLMEARFNFRKNGQFSMEKIAPFKTSICAILNNPKADVIGVRMEYYDESDTKHIVDVRQEKEEMRFYNRFEFPITGSVVLEEIFNRSLKLLNSVYDRLGR